MIEIVDVGRQSIWVRPANITAIFIPSPLSPGDGKCRMMVGVTALVEVSASEAYRVLSLLKES